MFDKLPDLIDPIYSAQHNKHFVARVNQQRFPRLEEQLVSVENDIEVDVKFYYNKRLKAHAFDMTLNSDLVLMCQRSLAPFTFPMNAAVTGAFVESMALAEDFPSEVEVYELFDEKISLLELIEDEMLLNIPLAPINQSSQLQFDNQAQEEASPKPEKLETRENPFAVLQGLKK